MRKGCEHSRRRLESGRDAKGEGVVVWNVSDNLTSILECF